MTARRFVWLFVVSFLVLPFLFPGPVFALGCDFSPAGATVEKGATTGVNVTITNSGDETITSVQLLNPDTEFMEFTSGSSSGFSASVNGGVITYSGGTLAPGGTATFTVSITGVKVTPEELQIDGYGSSGGDYSQCYASSGITITEPSATTAPVATTTTTVTTTTTTTTTTSSQTPVPTPKPDTKGPSVTITTILSKTYEQSPEIKASASDDSRVIKIEYSTDGGLNWFPIDSDSLGEKSIKVAFTPDIFEDGDYGIVVRAIDGLGNKGVSAQKTLVFDRLPPRVGPLTVLLGPLTVNPGMDGATELVNGVEYKFVVSAAGGPNKVSLNCNGMVYDFTKNFDSGFWFLKTKFEGTGECTPVITAVDGAGNIQETSKQKLRVNGRGKFEHGIITVYWYDDFAKKFTLWDAEPYGQTNPVKIEGSEGYGVVLPPGKYYLEAKSPGKRTAVSTILDTKETVFINDDWSLSPVWKFWQFREQKTLVPKSLGSGGWNKVSFALPKTNLGSITTLDIRGGYSVVGLATSWHPLLNEYLKALETISSQNKVFPVLIQESDSIATSLKRRGGYELPIYSDADGNLLKDTNLKGLPTTWIVDKFGNVILEKTGQLDAAEVRRTISELD